MAQTLETASFKTKESHSYLSQDQLPLVETSALMSTEGSARPSLNSVVTTPRSLCLTATKKSPSKHLFSAQLEQAAKDAQL
jgi:hypothetical protein